MTEDIRYIWSSSQLEQKIHTKLKEAMKQVHLQRENNLNPYASNNSANPDSCVNTSILSWNNNPFVDGQPTLIFRDFLEEKEFNQNQKK